MEHHAEDGVDDFDYSKVVWHINVVGGNMTEANKYALRMTEGYMCGLCNALPDREVRMRLCG